jgi:hypothetical protein
LKHFKLSPEDPLREEMRQGFDQLDLGNHGSARVSVKPRQVLMVLRAGTASVVPAAAMRQRRTVVLETAPHRSAAPRTRLAVGLRSWRHR